MYTELEKEPANLFFSTAAQRLSLTTVISAAIVTGAVQELKTEIESTVTMSPGSFNQTGDHYTTNTQSLHPARSTV